MLPEVELQPGMQAEVPKEIPQGISSKFEKAAFDFLTGFKKLLWWKKEALAVPDKLDAMAQSAKDHESKAQIESLRNEAKRITEATLTKISEQLGSNRGGWYEDQETREKYYIKFYDNPDQARAEFITNAIYAKLGIAAVQSSLFEMDGQLAIASREVHGAAGTGSEEQKGSSDVRDGFVADVYLANWDVVGLVHDNIVKGADGRMYRIDNGGSLIFRAQGGSKELSSTDIPELQTMLREEYPAGQVFEGITQEQMKAQATHVLEKLSEKDIDAFIKESGMTGEVAEKVRVGLKGRRKILAEQFGLAFSEERKQMPTERIPIALEKLKEQFERLREVELRPRVGILAAGHHVENQQVDVIDATDEGRVDVNFKLTNEHWQLLKERLAQLETVGGVRVGEIIYGKGTARHTLVEAYEIVQTGMTVKISKGTKKNEYGDEKEVRSAHGLVHIEVQMGETPMKPEELGERVHKIFTDILEIPGGLEVPDEEAERRYKLARYVWFHKLKQAPEDIEHRLVREEVAPGYFTFVENGAYKEYEAISPYAIFHAIGSVEAIPKILKSGGLFSTHERYRRGLLASGLSSTVDLETGGADNVFTRTITEVGAKSYDPGIRSSDAYFVFDSDLFDRTDWYAYSFDNYGGTDPAYFTDRQSPSQLFENQKTNGYQDANEQMFRNGISSGEIRAIAFGEGYCRSLVRRFFTEKGITELTGDPVTELLKKDTPTLKAALEKAGIVDIREGYRISDLSEDTRDRALRSLRDAGMTQIHGKPIEDFLVYARQQTDFIDLARGQEPRSMRPKKQMSEEELSQAA